MTIIDKFHAIFGHQSPAVTKDANVINELMNSIAIHRDNNGHRNYSDADKKLWDTLDRIKGGV